MLKSIQIEERLLSQFIKISIKTCYDEKVELNKLFYVTQKRHYLFIHLLVRQIWLFKTFKA